MSECLKTGVRASIERKGSDDYMSLIYQYETCSQAYEREYSDTTDNEDNSFRNHIRWPKSSLAET